MKITIVHWRTGAVLYETDVDGTRIRATRIAIERANLVGANLVGANLVGANLAGANLASANLDGANLVGANLAGANLDGANLDGANLDGASLAGASLAGASLDGANLDGASLAGANLASASLDGANLDGASLDGANLDGASLDGANLDGASQLRAADLSRIKADLFEVLEMAPAEVGGLLLALNEGRVDGTAYEGDCACLVGTIANVRGVGYRDLGDLRPNDQRPAEKWFLAIRKGRGPEESAVSAVTVEWIEEWIARRSEPRT